LLYTPAEAAVLLRVRESWLRRKAGARVIPCMSRPGFVGGSEPCEGGSHASTEEVSRRVA
jgi:hypothetical protein